jgi:hypothetical protein
MQTFFVAIFTVAQLLVELTPDRWNINEQHQK